MEQGAGVVIHEMGDFVCTTRRGKGKEAAERRGRGVWNGKLPRDGDKTNKVNAGIAFTLFFDMCRRFSLPEQHAAEELQERAEEESSLQRRCPRVYRNHPP